MYKCRVNDVQDKICASQKKDPQKRSLYPVFPLALPGGIPCRNRIFYPSPDNRAKSKDAAYQKREFIEIDDGRAGVGRRRGYLSPRDVYVDANRFDDDGGNYYDREYQQKKSKIFLHCNCF